jgi:hypothetical protein
MSTSFQSSSQVSLKEQYLIRNYFFSILLHHQSPIPHEDDQVDPIKKSLLVVYTQKKSEAKSQGNLNVSTPYIYEESRPTLPNVGTSSASWMASVIALSYTLSTHYHPILPSKLFLTTPCLN